jgi:hypothetical protein
MQSPSPFKRQCKMLTCPKLKMELPKVEYYFDDNEIMSKDAQVILLPEGGWRELYIGSPFMTPRKLGHICTPQYSIYKPSKLAPIVIDLTLE